MQNRKLFLNFLLVFHRLTAFLRSFFACSSLAYCKSVSHPAKKLIPFAHLILLHQSAIMTTTLPNNFVSWFNETSRLYEYGILHEYNKDTFTRFIIDNTECVHHCFANPLIPWLRMFFNIKTAIITNNPLTSEMLNWIYSQDLVASKVACDVWKQFVAIQPYCTFFDNMITKEEIQNKTYHLHRHFLKIDKHAHHNICFDLLNFIAYNTICYNSNMLHMKNHESWTLWNNFMQTTTYQNHIEKLVCYRVNIKRISIMRDITNFRIKLNEVENDLINKRNMDKIRRFIKYNEDAYHCRHGKMNKIPYCSIWEEFIKRKPYLDLVENRKYGKRKRQEDEQLSHRQSPTDEELADFLDGVF